MSSDIGRFLVHRNNVQCHLHINPELEVIWVESGSVSIRSDHSTETLGAGQAMLIFPYRLHAFEPEPGSSIYVFMFPFFLVESFYEKYAWTSQDFACFAVNEKLAQLIKYSLERCRDGNDIFTVRSLFYAFASVFAETPASFSKSTTSSKNTVHKALEYICEHMDEPLTLQGTADALGINKNSLAQMFEKHMCITFKRFLCNMRIEKATVLLEGTDLTVTEIAYSCGFGCLRSFNRQFSATFGYSPTEYRKKVKMSD